MAKNQTDNRYIEFRLNTQLYAVPLAIVKEVILKPETTAVPNMPTYFEGMINLRGQVIAVYNIKKRINLKVQDTNKTINDVIIIVEQNGINIGIIVDEVTRSLSVQPEMIAAAPLKEGDPAYHFISSVIRLGKDLILTLSVAELLELNKIELNKLKEITKSA